MKLHGTGATWGWGGAEDWQRLGEAGNWGEFGGYWVAVEICELGGTGDLGNWRNMGD